MDMAKHVIFGPDFLLDDVEQIVAPGPITGAAEVPVAEWRAVGYQDIGAFGDLLPYLGGERMEMKGMRYGEDGEEERKSRKC